MVAGGGLAVAGVGGFAHADAQAGGQAEGSPGLLSGNLVHLPVHTPVNVCGNTVSVVGLLNPATGNGCVNRGPGDGGGHPGPRPSHPASGSAQDSKRGPGSGAGNSGGAVAQGGAKGSPGLLSGNGLQLPVQVPLNVSGNTVGVVAVGNPSGGNTSVNGETPTGGKPAQPPAVVRPVTPTAAPAAPQGPVALAHTGADAVGYLLPGGGALLLGGALLYRRFRLG
ncbi:chaplin [Streptomyces sp. NPDC091268]|uniref:chaplin n=1 Tax=Streptomyces sp. NPDC091268 TaxID=3365979 RepID=UPI003803D4BA